MKNYYKGDNVILYVKFPDNINVAKVKVFSNINDNEIKQYLPNPEDQSDSDWENMDKHIEGGYYKSYDIPYDCNIGKFNVIYLGLSLNEDLTGDEFGDTNDIIYNINDEIIITDSFYVNESSDYGNKYNKIKIYGYIYNSQTNSTLSGCELKIYNMYDDKKIKNNETTSNDIGYWESHLYPGKYRFEIKKDGFQLIDSQFDVEIGDEFTEIQFNNIGLVPIGSTSLGKGIFPVGEKYINKYGMPLDGITIEIYDINQINEVDLNKLYVKTKTNNKGEWECYLNPGTYLLKILSEKYSIDDFIEIKVNNEGEFSFNQLSNERKIIIKNKKTNGNGNCFIVDNVFDDAQKPIVGCKVVARIVNGDNTNGEITAYDYTDNNGEWILLLDPGEYIIEYIHGDYIYENKRLQIIDEVNWSYVE